MAIRINHTGFLFLLAIMIAANVSVSCSRHQQYAKIIADAERIADEYPDSALALLGTIDPIELTQDSLKAKYYYVSASAHDSQSHIALSDSMISFSNDYYRGKDLKRSIRSATLLALYKFRIGERVVALKMLDSLSSLCNVPDSLVLEPLRNRVNLGTYYGSNESRIKRLISIDRNENWLPHYKSLLYFVLRTSSMQSSTIKKRGRSVLFHWQG